jgi:phosphoglycerate dehydrogenase-like enzyme
LSIVALPFLHMLTMANVVCTPHIGYVSREGFRFSP